jgi:hypothetical protein
MCDVGALLLAYIGTWGREKMRSWRDDAFLLSWLSTVRGGVGARGGDGARSPEAG